MKIISKIAAAVAGLALMGSSAFAQSLDDAKKAIDAEQLQKAKAMLKNLVVTQSTKDENYFYLGWVYVKQDYADSAKAVFQKGLNINPNSALNYAGLGIVARMDKDASGASTNFNKALSLAGKDTKPYVYIAKGYLMPETNGKVTPANATAALDVLNKGNAATSVPAKKNKSGVTSSTDPELFTTLGEADRLLMKSDDAYTNFETALTLDPKSAGANVALGVLWKYADNFNGAEDQFKAALAIDPNYGPAYREWAETDLRWAQSSPKDASAKVKEAADNYKKYITLTDYSPESQMRYADFLINAGDFKTLQQVAADLSKSSGTNLRAYRYLGYAAFENKDYPAGLAAMNTWVTKADPKRVIPRDYLYLGRLQIANKDTAGIQTLHKALELDTTQVDLYGEIAGALYAQKKYMQAGDAYALFISKSRKTTLNDYLREGNSYYQSQMSAAKPDTTILNKADSAFSYIQHKATTPLAVVAYERALVNDAKDLDRNNIKGLAKPHYEQFLALITAKTTPFTDSEKSEMVNAYDYLGSYYEYKVKDEGKAAENFGKARDIDPTNKTALDYFKRKGAKTK